MTGGRGPAIHPFMRALARLLFGVYHDIHVEGAGHVPKEGPVIIACNHPTYLDPAFLMLKVKRPIRFMAWEKPFRVPVLGSLIRAYGAIPVDMKKPGKESFEAAVRLLRRGEVFGIFPEGGRTKGGNLMNPLKSGVARLAMMTGAPIVPATITGGSRVWPREQIFPKPGPIRVTFHPPIRVRGEDRLRWRRDKGLEQRLIGDVLDAIHATLIPAKRAEERVERLWLQGPQPPSPAVEGLPFLFFALSWWLTPAATWRYYALPALPILAGYLAAILLEQIGDMRGRAVKAARNLAPWLVLLTAGIAVMRRLSLFEIGLVGGWLAMVLWLQLFRFSEYRRIRAAALLVSYAGWLWRLRSLQ